MYLLSCTKNIGLEANEIDAYRWWGGMAGKDGGGAGRGSGGEAAPGTLCTALTSGTILVVQRKLNRYSQQG